MLNRRRPALRAINHKGKAVPRQEVIMEIQALRVLITEDDLNSLLKEYGPKDVPLEELRLRISPEGIVVTGVYPLLVNISFETVWELSVRDGKACARLAKLKALGMPGNIFRSALLKLLGDAARTEPWLQIDGDSVVVDVDRALLAEGLRAKSNLTGFVCRDGELVIEGGVRG